MKRGFLCAAFLLLCFGVLQMTGCSGSPSDNYTATPADSAAPADGDRSAANRITTSKSAADAATDDAAIAPAEAMEPAAAPPMAPSTTGPYPTAPATSASRDVARRAIIQKTSELHSSLPELPAETFVPEPPADTSNEDYAHINENDFISAKDEPLSTFSIDVDTASYSNIRRFLSDGRTPPPDAVRIEEMINYFDYNYDPPKADEETPFAANFELGPCPWNEKNRLVRIGLKGKTFEKDERPTVNLVFLIDVSGSMNQPNKLPLLKDAMRMLVQNLSERDRVALVVYAGAAGTVLQPTSCERKDVILSAIERLQAGGSTAGGAGIEAAYSLAEANRIDGHVNRVILCTDGDFNVGISSQGELTRLIEEKAKTGIFLTVLGFGSGNLKDSRMEMLADKGNGNYGYIDTLLEAQKLLVEQSAGTLVTIAKDVKIQVDFNPSRVGAYRLIGYENRKLQNQDFRDDKKDAGEIGAGHMVTALYEITPIGDTSEVPEVEPSRYQTTAPTTEADTDELLTVRLRYKQPDGDTSTEISFQLKDEERTLEETSKDFRFAAAVAELGLLLRGSQYKGAANFDQVLTLAEEAKGIDKLGFRTEFIEMVRTAKSQQR